VVVFQIRRTIIFSDKILIIEVIVNKITEIMLIVVKSLIGLVIIPQIRRLIDIMDKILII
jgi:hypothetical protein